ncbi:mediator of RNA polymerase II transcription subunit 27 [Tanacetum coccineum]
MAGYKHNQLRHKSFDDIQKLFDKALKKVNTFVPMDTKKVEGSKAKVVGSKTRVEESSKRAGEQLDRESTKKQNVEDETEQAELQECCEIIPFDEDVVNTIPLATKQSPIVDYKITKDARKIYYHITRAYRITQVYIRFEDMLKMFDREDLEVLYRIVKDRFKSTKPVGDNRVLWGNLMTMFEPSAGDEIWREQERYLIKSWKLIDSCGVHCLMLESMYIYMLMKVIKGHARNKNRLEGCIAEETITEETIEFFSEYHKSMETIGIPPDKQETYENEEGKPLSTGKSSEVSAELF